MDHHIDVLEVRHATPYQDLLLKAYKESPFAFSEHYKDHVTRKSIDFVNEVTPRGQPFEHFVLGAFVHDQLVGFLTFIRDQRRNGRHKAMIHSMYVAPTYRNRHIGQSLIQNVLKRAKQIDGLEQIHLWVLHSDTSATLFYKKQGFESSGILLKNDLKINGRYIHGELMSLYF